MMSQIVRCGECGERLADKLPLSESPRDPCPVCGSSRLSVSITVREEAQVTSQLAALQERDGKAIGFTEGPRKGLSSSASQTDDGKVEFSLEGRSPQGEEETLQVCETLIHKLSESGLRWSDPVEGLQDVDCEARDLDTDRRIRIQVVRAVVDPALWIEVAQSGSTNRAETIDEIADALRTAIESKANPCKIPESQRADITLALDASRLPGHVLDAPVSHFVEYFRDWAASLGFEGIWIVGPNARLTWRLDAPQ